MFETLRIKNFRSIKDSKDLKLSNLNIIVGPNNSGKSSILYSILLLKQTIEDKDPNATLVTSGTHLDLGSYFDLINANKPEELLDIHFKLSKSLLQSFPFFEMFQPVDNLIKRCNEFQIGFKFDRNTDEIKTSAFHLADSKTKEFYSGKNLNGKWTFSGFPEEIGSYIRVNFYHFVPVFHFSRPKSKDKNIIKKLVALSYSGGALTSLFKSVFEDILYVGPIRQMIPRYGFLGAKHFSELTPMGQNLIRILSSNRRSRRTKKTILEELNYWLDKKFNTLKNIRILDIDPGKSVKSIIADDPRGDKNINLASMGSGLSQLVPVIVQTVLTPRKGCIIIEQPEIHLHPAAQATLGDLFIKYAKDKRQIIVETHSEHLLLRVRRRVAEGRISPDLVSIFFVDKSKNETRIRKLKLQKNGHFRSWPAGFFEGGYKEAMALAMAQAEDRSK